VARPKAVAVVKGVKTLYDSGKDVLHAVRQCNPGGIVHFEKNETYTIGTALDLTNLKNVDLDIQGTIKVINQRHLSLRSELMNISVY
jgi:galacturan 1,4-alpha-galacturonidase